jgi:uridylate kinase
MKIVLKIGGSIVMPKEVDVNYVKKLAAKLKEWAKKHELVVVVGGGRLSREFGELGRKLTKEEDYLDLIGIYASRLNASLLVAALEGAACPAIPRSELEFLDVLRKFPGKIIICGGFRPKQRTDAVSVELAKIWNADYVIKGTNVNYVYTKDPKKYKNAKPVKKLTFSELKQYAEQEHKANMPTIMDMASANIVAREKVEVIILNGKDLKNIEKVLDRQKFKGTVIGY